MEQTTQQTASQVKNANLLEKWLTENLPHISMKDKGEYKTNRIPISFICQKHGEYVATPESVKKAKYGCRKCGHQVQAQSQVLPYEDFLVRAKAVHGDKYVYYSEKESEWNGSCSPVKIYCLQCRQSFFQRADSHLEGHDCPSCNNKVKQLPYNDFVAKAKEIHGDRYSYYDEQTAEWSGSKKKVKVFCLQCESNFYQFGYAHLRGQGCPRCNVGGGVGIDSEKNFLANPKLAKSDCYLYYIKIAGSYKIGITKNNIANRFTGESYEILKSRKTTRLFAWRSEQKMLNKFKEYKKINPCLAGNGATECFGVDISQLDDFDEIFNHDFTELIN